MQLHVKLTTPVVVTVMVCLMTLVLISGTQAAPQGNELYREITEARYAKEHANYNPNVQKQEQLEIRQAITKEAQLLQEEKKKSKCEESIKDQKDNGERVDHIEIREAAEANTKELHRVEKYNNCLEAGKKAQQESEHKIKVRQVDQSESQEESDIGSDGE